MLSRRLVGRIRTLRNLPVSWGKLSRKGRSPPANSCNSVSVASTLRNSSVTPWARQRARFALRSRRARLTLGRHLMRLLMVRSEERRVGKECRCRGGTMQWKKKKDGRDERGRGKQYIIGERATTCGVRECG